CGPRSRRRGQPWPARRRCPCQRLGWRRSRTPPAVHPQPCRPPVDLTPRDARTYRLSHVERPRRPSRNARPAVLGMIATVHVADLGAAGTVRAMRRRPKVGDVPGLRWADLPALVPLASTRPPNLRRAALLAFWDDEDDAMQ